MRRLTRELKALQKSPPEGILARPEGQSNPFRVHFCVDGPPDTVYEGGKYHGVRLRRINTRNLYGRELCRTF